MSNYNYPEQNRAVENMLYQQLRGHSHSSQTDDGQGQHQHNSGHGQYQPQQQSYHPNMYDGPPSHGAHGAPNAPGSNPDYDEDNDIMPPAPTPPVNNIPAGVLAYMSNSGGNSIGAPRAPPNSEHTNNLLNLLKFQQPGSRPEQIMSSSTYQPRIVAPAPVGQDPTGLLAAMISGTHDEGHKDTPPPSYANASSPPTDTQSYLLNLLNRPKPAQGDPAHQQQFAPDSAKSSKSITLTPQSTNDSNTDFNREHHQHYQPHLHSYQNTSPTYSRHSDGYSYQHLPPAPESHHPQPAELGPSSHFQSVPATYNSNPFTDAARSSPMDKTPKSSITPAAPGSTQSHQSPVQLLKKPSVTSSPRSAIADARPAGSERSSAASPERQRCEDVDADEPADPEDAEQAESVEDVEQLAAAEPSADAVDEADPTEPTSEVDEPQEPETVAEAVSELAPRLDREVQEALDNRASEDAADDQSAADAEEVKSQPDMPEEEDAADDAPVEESQHDEDRAIPGGTVEDAADEGVEEAPLDDPTDDIAAQEAVLDSWENADADVATLLDQDPGIPVYNFPMRPWIGLKLISNDEIERPSFRVESISDVTRLKKDFDQIDRNLVTASETHIIYGMSRHGGLRVICQDDGKDAKLFTDTNDRIFNVSVSLSPPTEPPVKEAIIGTGVSGTVYWTLIREGSDDHINEKYPEQYGFALPPINSQEGDTPGGVLKTRARPSSMHPEYFAIGRGKTIHVIWPSLIMQGDLFKSNQDRTVDVEKLMSTCSLKINTGKAGKDFTFSADDTTIVTLDKAGKVKFWDIRRLTASRADDGQPSLPLSDELELKEPILSLNTTSDGEKPWPTSVLLVDKPKPYQRRTAQRYMIVGTKQNHSFQLWDLTLRKVVQEINLPHGKDSDAACSLMYHSTTGMIIIGHPSRNSVYFLHLSAPKYNLKISQVDYMTRLATPDSYVPMPDCTAVLSGYREIRFSASGTLRSLDLLSTPAATDDPDEPVLFELYAMHSKGVSCLHVRQRDLGWSAENRVVNPKDAVECKTVSISKISSPPQVPTPAETLAVSEPSSSQIPIRVIQRRDAEDSSAASASIGRRGVPPDVVVPAKPLLPDVALTLPPQPAEKPEKQKGKRKKGASAEEKGNNTPRPGNKEARSANLGQNVAAPTLEQLESYTSKMEGRLKMQIVDLGLRFDSLVDRVDASLDGRDRAFDFRSREILKTVSQQLNDNTQNLLVDLVQSEFDKRLVPVISERAQAAISQHMGGIDTLVSQSVQKEVAESVPYAVNQVLRSPDMTKSIAQAVGNAVSAQVSEHVENELNTRVFPAFKTMAKTSVQQVQQEFEQKLSQTTERLEYNVRAESAKVDQLVGMVQSLQESLKAMATTQAQFQAEILKLQQKQHASPATSSGPAPPYQQTQAAPKPPINPDLERDINLIADLMRDDQYESALVRWLQSNYLNEVFEHYYWNVNPGFLTQVSALVQLSVAATMSEHFGRGKLRERVSWLDTLIHSFKNNLGPNLEPKVREITPQIMALVEGRIETIYYDITRQAPHDPMLKTLSGLIAACNNVIRTTKGDPTSPGQPDQRHMQYPGPQPQYEQPGGGGQYQGPPQGQYEHSSQYQQHSHTQQPQGQPQWY